MILKFNSKLIKLKNNKIYFCSLQSDKNNNNKESIMKILI